MLAIKEANIWRRLNRFWIVIVASGTLAGCGSQSSFVESLDLFTDDSVFQNGSNSQFGSYLAGRHAGSSRDTTRAVDFYDRVLDFDPNNEQIRDRAFLLSIADGQFDRAIDQARAIVEQHPEQHIAHMVLGLHAFKNGIYPEARSHFDAAGRAPFSKLSAALLSAWSYVGEGDFNTAIKTIDEFKINAAFDIFRHYHMALIHELNGNIADAEKDFKATIEAGGDGSVRVVQAYGQFLERQGRAEDAAELYGNFSSLAPDHPLIDFAFARIDQGIRPELLVGEAHVGAAETLYGLASALAQDRSIELPFVYLRFTLFMRDDFDLAHILLADLFEQSKRYEDAIDSYSRIGSESGLVHHVKLQIAHNLDRLERTEEAISLLRRFTKNNPADFQAYVALADLLRGRERFEESIEEYTEAVNLLKQPRKQHWSVYYARGIAHERADMWPEAEADFLRALELHPNQPLVLNYLGYSWVEQRHKLEEALEMIQSAVELRPGDGYIVDSLGWAYYQLGYYDVAVEHLERAVSLTPEDPVINDHLGDAYWRVGRPIEARFQWRHALSLNADEELLPVLERKLDRGLEEVSSLKGRRSAFNSQ